MNRDGCLGVLAADRWSVSILVLSFANVRKKAGGSLENTRPLAMIQLTIRCRETLHSLPATHPNEQRLLEDFSGNDSST